MICEYGCGQEAKYQLKNGKWCCSKSQNSCPSLKKKFSKAQAGENHPFYNKHLSDEHKEKIRNKHKGRNITWGDKISKSLKGHKPWNKGMKLGYSGFKGHKHIESALIKMRRPRNVESIYKGKKRPEYKGSDNPNWKGGSSFRCNIDYTSTEYSNWRTKIFKRDNYICKMCNKGSQYLNAHHILKVSIYPQFILETWNGITLCKKCHIKTFFNEDKYISEFIDYTSKFEEII